MKKLYSLFVFSLFTLVAIAQPPDVPAETGSTFGETIKAEGAMSVEEMIKYVESRNEGEKVEVKIQGVVTKVCEKEGCWIKVKSPNGDMMVKMKDHKFLVPVALNGKTVVIEGIAQQKVTSVKELKHYAEDAGKSKKEIDAIKEPKKELVMQAKGILVV